LARQTIECEIVGLLDSRPGNARAGAYVRREAIPGAEIEIAVGQQVPAVNFVIGEAGRRGTADRMDLRAIIENQIRPLLTLYPPPMSALYVLSMDGEAPNVNGDILGKVSCA
jgi:hypothetical protein